VCTITWICGASGNGDSPKYGSGEESSLMKTDENWSFSMYAFFCRIDIVGSVSLQWGTPEPSHFLEFTLVNSFLDLSSVTMSMPYVLWAALQFILTSCWMTLYLVQSSLDFVSLAFL